MSTSAGSDGVDASDDSAGAAPTERTYGSNNKRNRAPDMDSTESTTSEKEGTNYSVTRNVIRVGAFKINGKKKYFAVLPPNMIRSQLQLEDLFSYWDLPAPNFILETNASNEHREKIISVENAPYILRDIFQPDKPKNEEGNGMAEATQDAQDASESTNMGHPEKTETAEPQNEEYVDMSDATQDTSESTNRGVPHTIPEDEVIDDITEIKRPASVSKKKRGLSWIQKEAPWLEKLKRNQEIQRKELSTEDWML
jgi:hypothetical protein